MFISFKEAFQQQQQQQQQQQIQKLCLYYLV